MWEPYFEYDNTKHHWLPYEHPDSKSTVLPGWESKGFEKDRGTREAFIQTDVSPILKNGDCVIAELPLS